MKVGVAGQPDVLVGVDAYDGDSSWLDWNLISGRLTVSGKPVTARIVGEIFTPGGGSTLSTSWQTLGGAAAGLTVSHYGIALTPGTGIQAYISALDRALGPDYLLLLAMAGLAIAIVGALGPASWAVGSRTSTALRAE